MAHVRESEENERDPSDLLITASFLSIPIASMLWAVVAFTVAVSAFCVQGTNNVGMILLPSVLGVLALVGFITLVFFWRAWKRQIRFGNLNSWFRKKVA